MTAQPTRRFRETLIGRRWRLFTVLCAFLLFLIAAIWLRPKKGAIEPPPPAPPFPLEFLEGEPEFFDLYARSIGEPLLTLHSVSSDRKWLVITARGVYPPQWFFDITHRRFVAKYEHSVHRTYRWWPHLAAWTSRTIVMEMRKPHQTRYDRLLKAAGMTTADMRADSFLYEIDAATSRMRFLCSWRSGIFQTTGMWQVFATKDRSRVAFSVLRDLLVRKTEQFHVIGLETGRRRVFSDTLFGSTGKGWVGLYRWLSDDRTLSFYRTVVTSGSAGLAWRIERLYFLDPFNERKPREKNLLQPFERLRRQGGLAPDEGEIVLLRLMKLFDQERRTRLAVTFASVEHPRDLAGQKSSIWDLDLETGNLTRLLDLQYGIARFGSIVCSPSGESFIAAPSSLTALTTRPVPPIRPILYKIGRAPVVLPFSVVCPLRLGDRLGPSLKFLDDETLVYTGAPCDLWKFDLRTGQSELLWRRKPPQPAPTSPTLFLQPPRSPQR